MTGSDKTPEWYAAAHAPNDAPHDRPAPGAVTDEDVRRALLAWNQVPRDSNEARRAWFDPGWVASMRRALETDRADRAALASARPAGAEDPLAEAIIAAGYYRMLFDHLCAAVGDYAYDASLTDHNGVRTGASLQRWESRLLDTLDDLCARKRDFVLDTLRGQARDFAEREATAPAPAPDEALTEADVTPGYGARVDAIVRDRLAAAAPARGTEGRDA